MVPGKLGPSLGLQGKGQVEGGPPHLRVWDFPLPWIPLDFIHCKWTEQRSNKARLLSRETFRFSRQ